VFKQKQKKA
jgi:small subunit ribosomal protein S11